MRKKFLFIIVLSLFCLTSLPVFAQKKGDVLNFFVDPEYDLFGREEISAKLIKISDYAYFYVENDWFSKLDSSKKNNVRKGIRNLAKEFDNKIYPVLTSVYGKEWSPGIDNDRKITVLMHQLRGKAKGYFSTKDEYSRFQNPFSNEREMVYLDVSTALDPLAPSFLSHEFTHLITFNQKERKRGISEEVWLNEARAEYSPTLCGYNSTYKGSYLESRVKEFLRNPQDSITEWKGKAEDYGALTVFVHYLVEHYGVEILADSLHSSKKGIDSLNYALLKNHFNKSFSQIFTDWAIAVLVNDCSLGERYCFRTPGLENLKIVPSYNYLPPSYQSTLTVYGSTKNWSGKWQKIIGGSNSLTFNFISDNEVPFTLPYVLCRNDNKCTIGYIFLDDNYQGEKIIPNFGKEYKSLTIIPLLENKFSDFTDNEEFFRFHWVVKSSYISPSPNEKALIEALLKKIEQLKKQIALAKARLNFLLAQKKKQITCGKFTRDLYYGLRNDNDVYCLQKFLKEQGKEIYPEGLLTGNFLYLTKRAVIRFQEKYKKEILSPLGLSKGTGYFGPLSRKLANKIISGTK